MGTPAVGQRVWHKANGWGTLLEINYQPSGKTGAPTALVDWETHRVQDWMRGPTQTWVNLSSLSTEGPAIATSRVSGDQKATPTPDKAEIPPGVVSPSPLAPPTPPALPSAQTRTEQLQWIKLVLEIGVVIVTLIGGIIALVWRSR